MSNQANTSDIALYLESVKKLISAGKKSKAIVNSLSFSYSQTAKLFLSAFSILLKGTNLSGIMIFFGLFIIGISNSPSNSAPITNSGLTPQTLKALLLSGALYHHPSVPLLQF